MSPAASRGKIAGAALLAVAAVALVVGIVMAVSGGGSGGQQASGGPNGSGAASGSSGAAPTSTAGGNPGGGASSSTSVSRSTRPSKPGEPRRGRSGRPGPYPGGATTTVVPAPPANPGRSQGSAGRAGGAQQVAHGAESKRAPVRVYNNSTIRGMAHRAAKRIRRDGYHVIEVDNYSQGVIPATTVYYRPGRAEKATAESLGRDIHARVKPRFRGIRHASPGVIVILTKDYRN